MAVRWIDAVPATSAEAARWVRRALWSALAVFLGTMAFSVVLLVWLDADDPGLVPTMGLAGTVLCIAVAVTHRETYHRLKGQGK